LGLGLVEESMPPKPQYSREQVIDAAFGFAGREGLAGITARGVAAELGSSVAPIYANFEDIEALKRAVVGRVFAIARQMLRERYTDDRFLDIGIAGLRFAREHPVLFRELVLGDGGYMAEYQQELGGSVLQEMASDPGLADLSDEELREVLLKMRVFQLGLYAMVANGMLPMDFGEAQQIELLASAGEDVVAGVRLRRLSE
jgi:AcrR family transcriptional regulator